MKNNTPLKKIESAVLGSGCFWCAEAIFSQTKGVLSAISGYAGGQTENPTYEKVLSGQTGHAETVKVTYDPEIITYANLLEIFFSTHNPTTPNRQGNDIGTQYRSIILYQNDDQRKTAQKAITDLEAQKIYPDPIVTEVLPLEKFYPAEEYHQKYFTKNPNKAYCQLVIAPKLSKFK